MSCAMQRPSVRGCSAHYRHKESTSDKDSLLCEGVAANTGSPLFLVSQRRYFSLRIRKSTSPLYPHYFLFLPSRELGTHFALYPPPSLLVLFVSYKMLDVLLCRTGITANGLS